MNNLPPRQGLYDPQFEKDACGFGFIANINGAKSHDIIKSGIEILINLEHRGATGFDPETGDGAGILLQIPHRFFTRLTAHQFELPASGKYGVGMLFLPHEAEIASEVTQLIETQIGERNLNLLGWRVVPTDSTAIGKVARAAEPLVMQFFVTSPDNSPEISSSELERQLFVLRKCIEKKILRHNYHAYLPSLSASTIVYKGLLTPPQMPRYFPDLTEPDFESALALVHSRFSTNTFPTWERAHPYRLIAHNGEINTLRGNTNWIITRQSLLESPLFGDDIELLLPAIMPGGSDSAAFDNVLELLMMSGRSLTHAMMMMIPEAFESNTEMADEKKAFYEFHQSLLEPWDGPSAIAFTDGHQIGATLDRNGLRPARYTVTRDGKVVMASETGVLEIAPENVLEKGRLEPGKMFLLDLDQGRIISDQELKHQVVTRQPYRQWLTENKLNLKDLSASVETENTRKMDAQALLQWQKAFGYTTEELRILLTPMAVNGEEALGSMGNDTPLAVLSDRPQLLYNYFKQLFAQVTNPPIDPIREELVMSISSAVGTELNLLDETPLHCRQLALSQPILLNPELEQIKQLDKPGFATITLPALFVVDEDGQGLEQSLHQLCQSAAEAVRDGVNIIILSDRGVDAEMAPIPALLAVSAVHQHLIRQELRTRCGLIVESGEPREVHHFALLISFGASAVNPYLALETLDEMKLQGLLPAELERKKVAPNYVKAINKGLLKIFSKMGISTLQSYHGAGIFEIVGLSEQLVDDYFTGTASRLGGIGLHEIALEMMQQHEHAFAPNPASPAALYRGGQYQWRKNGEYHLYNPDTVSMLQHATGMGDYKLFKKYTAHANNDAERQATLRGLFSIKNSGKAIPIEEVESVEAIMKRFCSGAMSLGSISREAHETLAIAMNQIGGKSNTGEGGEDAARFNRDANGDWRRSAIKQVASARFGVTSHYLVNASELQIKMAQGAKPGEGGQLPGHKVDDYIARLRHSVPGVTLISPPPHHDIYSIEDLAQLIYDLKNVNPHADISVKLVAEVGVGTVAAGVAKAHADSILISGYDGGTGASPLTSIKHAGLPWEIGLAEAHQVLLMNNLRSRVRLQTDGQLKTGRDVIVATLLGAEEYGFSTAPLVTMGCILMRKCHLNTCPVGVATQDPRLRQKFTGKPEYIVNFFRFVAQEVREYMAEMGFRSLNEMVGRADLLEPNRAIMHYKAQGLDFSAILYQPQVGDEVKRFKCEDQDHGVEKYFDHRLLAACQPALQEAKPVELNFEIRNFDRTVGAMLGGEISRRYGADGLPDGTIQLNFKGSAGQSFGAFIPRGMTLELVGDANDYVGKGLSGGVVVLKTPPSATYDPRHNIIAGNTVLYGATAGEAYINGVVGERFAVRNSGAITVVEGVGDHGCEYMTGGRVVVLGKTGRNFAAGMSGGIAYVLNEEGTFFDRCNPAMVVIEAVKTDQDIAELHALVQKHYQYTGSRIAEEILASWPQYLSRFVKVMPHEYRRALHELTERHRNLSQPVPSQTQNSSQGVMAQHGK